MIQRAYKSHYPKLIEIWESSVRATHDFLSESDIEFYKSMILEEYFDKVKLFFYQDEDSNILAFIGIVDTCIEMLFVEPNSFSEGIGRRLVQFAIKKYNINKVDVNEQNRNALAFYQKLGFSLIGRSETDSCGKPYPILHLELIDII
jgi:putative acetyltransferase